MTNGTTHPLPVVSRDPLGWNTYRRSVGSDVVECCQGHNWLCSEEVFVLLNYGCEAGSKGILGNESMVVHQTRESCIHQWHPGGCIFSLVLILTGLVAKSSTNFCCCKKSTSGIGGVTRLLTTTHFVAQSSFVP